MAGPKGFEPSVFSVTGRRVNRATPRTQGELDGSRRQDDDGFISAGPNVTGLDRSGKPSLRLCSPLYGMPATTSVAAH